jgi:hypothetical protein
VLARRPGLDDLRGEPIDPKSFGSLFVLALLAPTGQVAQSQDQHRRHLNAVRF